MPRFDMYRSPEAAPRRRGLQAAAWATLCILLQLSVLFWLWVVLAG